MIDGIDVAVPGPRLPRIGVVATDELRVAGLQAVLGDGARCQLEQLSAPRMLRSYALDLVLIDSSATEHLLELIETFRRLRPLIRLIVLGAETDFEHVERVIGAGAKGYVSYAAREDELRTAVEVVLDGSVWAPRKVLSRLLEKATGAAIRGPREEIRFTLRETEVLKLLVQGHPNREIARLLGVDESTVKAHLGRTMRKAGVSNRTALGMKALERGWIRMN